MDLDEASVKNKSFFRSVSTIAQLFAENKLWTRQSLRPKLM